MKTKTEWGTRRTRGAVGTVIPASGRAEAESTARLVGGILVRRVIIVGEWEEPYVVQDCRCGHPANCHEDGVCGEACGCQCFRSLE